MTLKRVHVTDAMKEVMVNAARRAYPAEACGAISGDHCEELPNHADGKGHFRLLAEDLAGFARDHGGYDGVWHSHPSGSIEPSEMDWAYHPIGKALVIVAGDEVVVHYGREFELYTA